MRRMEQLRSIAFSALVTVLAFALWTGGMLAAEYKELHSRAWQECLDAMQSDPAAQYGVYAYRSVAVMHPEVYLHADRLTLDVLGLLPGSRLAYRSRNVRDVELHLRIARRETQGGAFSIGMMSIVPDSIYDAGAPKSLADWMDVRVPSVAILLKSESDRLSTLECAMLRYSHLVELTSPNPEPFVVIDKKGSGYLATDTSLWLAGLSNRAVKDWKSVTPVLVFNRNSVFSALTGRDDRVSDTALGLVMSKLGSAVKFSLNGKDRERFASVAPGTTLAEPEAVRLAVIVASGLADRKQPLVDSMWTAVSRTSEEAQCADLLLEEAYFWANRLSPSCASLATHFTGLPLTKALPQVQRDYLEWVGRPVNPQDTAEIRTEAWGCIWSYDLFLTSLPDNIRTRAGSALSQAIAMSAVLDLAGIENYQIGVQMGDKQIPDQHWVFADTGRHQYNLGVWTSVPPPSSGTVTRPIPLLITGFVLKGRAVRIGAKTFCSRFDELMVGESLARIARCMPLANLSVVAPDGKLATLQKFLFALTNDEFEPALTYWPRPQSP